MTKRRRDITVSGFNQRHPVGSAVVYGRGPKALRTTIQEPAQMLHGHVVVWLTGVYGCVWTRFIQEKP